MSMMVSFVLSFFPRDVLDEILNLIESVSEDFPSYSDLAHLAAWDLQVVINVNCNCTCKYTNMDLHTSGCFT